MFLSGTIWSIWQHLASDVRMVWPKVSGFLTCILAILPSWLSPSVLTTPRWNNDIGLFFGKDCMSMLVIRSTWMACFGTSCASRIRTACGCNRHDRELGNHACTQAVAAVIFVNQECMGHNTAGVSEWQWICEWRSVLAAEVHHCRTAMSC